MQSSMIHRLFWGIVLVAAGVIFLLNQTGTISIDIGRLFSDYWPVIIILFGLQGILLQHAGAFWWNPIVVLIGVMLLGRNLDWFQWDLSDIFQLIGPIALILFGIGMITRGHRPRRRQREHWRAEQWNPVTPPPVPPIPPGPPPAPPGLDDPHLSYNEAHASQPGGPTFQQAEGPQPKVHHYGWKQRNDHKDRWKLGWNENDWHQRVNYSRFIGDLHLGHDYWELRPMNISQFIGDTTLDLTKAQIPVGETRVYVSSFIGDVKVFVPNDIGVGIQVISSCLIGDVKVLDQRRGGIFNQMSVETPSFADSDKRVVLIVSSFIGDVRVTKVG
jgi:lia operon protein LiaF